MKRITFFLVILTFLISCNSNDSINKIINENQKHNSIHYTIQESYFYSDGIDTTFTPYEVWVVKDDKDTLRNGYIWANNNYRPYNMIYQSGDLYLSIPPKKTTIFYSGFKADLISPVDWIDMFLKPELLKKQIENPENNVTILDTFNKNKQGIFLKIQFPENDKKQKTTFEYIIDKESMVPIWSMMKVKSEKNVYYDELEFSKPDFDKFDKAELIEKHNKVLADNPIATEGTGSEIERLEAMLHTGDKAPDFIGKYYSTGKDFHLKDYIGKDVIIIDFWYTHCPPCVKAIPHLSGLSRRYKDKGLKIFGLNSVDNQPHSKKYLKKFLKNRKLDYEVVLIDPEVDLNYKVNGYPTMYIIDKSGKIAFVELGFEEKKFAELEKKIEEMIKE